MDGKILRALACTSNRHSRRIVQATDHVWSDEVCTVSRIGFDWGSLIANNGEANDNVPSACKRWSAHHRRVI